MLGLLATRTEVLATCMFAHQSVSGASVWSDGKDKQDVGGQLSTWDVDTFIKVVRELAPHISFREVVFELDHPGFYIGDTQGLRLVKTALVRGLQQELFPIEALYRIWKNYEGQVGGFFSSLFFFQDPHLLQLLNHFIECLF